MNDESVVTINFKGFAAQKIQQLSRDMGMTEAEVVQKLVSDGLVERSCVGSLRNVLSRLDTEYEGEIKTKERLVDTLSGQIKDSTEPFSSEEHQKLIFDRDFAWTERNNYLARKDAVTDVRWLMLRLGGVKV